MTESCVKIGPICYAVKVSERRPKFTCGEGMCRLDLGNACYRMLKLISSFFNLSDEQKYSFFKQDVFISAI